MKTRVLFFILVLSWGSVDLYGSEYPTDKGAYSVGGNLALASMSGDLYGTADDIYLILAEFDYKQFSWGHVAWGIQFQLGYFQLENNDMSIVSIGPTLGYYLGGPNSTFYPYIEAGFSGGRVMLNDIFADDDAVTWEMEISMGILRFITPRVAIELAIDYSHGYTDYDKGDEFYESRMGLSLGLSVFNY